MLSNLKSSAPTISRPAGTRRITLELCGQVLLVLAAWVYLCGLHQENDGLWFQGDAPRHAMNGLFWKDFLLSGSADPLGYTQAYYARYPAICPNRYPPGFYLLEAVLFGLFGPSPYVGKGLVFGFALLAALYTLAWLRRWAASAAGGVAALLLLTPGLTTWAHAVMLNVPALALGLAALYHARRALETPDGPRCPAHLYAATALALFGILTYPTTGVVVFIGLAWLMALGRWKLLARPRTQVLAIGCAVLLLPWAYVVCRWAPQQLRQAAPQAHGLTDPWGWAFYPHHVTELLDPLVLALGVVGGIIGLAQRRWRQETVLLLLWLAVCYAVFSLIEAKEGRYLLLVCPPAICFNALTLLSVSERVEALAPVLRKGMVFSLCLVILVVAEAELARHRKIPSVHDFREVVAFVERMAPSEPILYDGAHDGVFIFYIRGSDPNYHRQVVLGPHLLRAAAPAEPADEAVESALLDSGCRWLVIEFGVLSEGEPLAQALRRVVTRDAFEHVHSFPIARKGVQRVGVYRVRNPARRPGARGVPVEVPGFLGPDKIEPIRGSILIPPTTS
jgi:hypothetical protein